MIENCHNELLLTRLACEKGRSTSIANCGAGTAFHGEHQGSFSPGASSPGCLAAPGSCSCRGPHELPGSKLRSACRSRVHFHGYLVSQPTCGATSVRFSGASRPIANMLHLALRSYPLPIELLSSCLSATRWSPGPRKLFSILNAPPLSEPPVIQDQTSLEPQHAISHNGELNKDANNNQCIEQRFVLPQGANDVFQVVTTCIYSVFAESLDTMSACI